MKRYPSSRAFTIIELLVVVSIIALLVGILLPAIGKARDQAQLSRSQANISQLGKAAVIYAAEFADRQVTFINDNFAQYGTSGPAAATNFNTVTGYPHPPLLLGYGRDPTSGVAGTWGYWFPGTPNVNAPAANWEVVTPINFATKFGSFRYVNTKAFNTYLNGRFYDPIFYAPKDSAVMASTEPLFDNPDEFFPALPSGSPIRLSSYVLSPAAMFSPDVFGLNKSSGTYFKDPFTAQLTGGFRCPSMSQAAYGNLKTHLMEHHWLQNRRKECNPLLAPGTYDGCEPFYFNLGASSSPVTLFYDGHVGPAGVRDSMEATKRMVTQSAGEPGAANHGLWSKNTPMAGSYDDWGTGGYFSSYAVDYASTSFHILTIDGIRGRDFVGK